MSEKESTTERKCLNCNETITGFELFCTYECKHGYTTRLTALFNKEYKPTLRSLD